MDETDHRLAALQSQVGRLQAELIAVKISGSYAVHALTAALCERGTIAPQEVARILDVYADGFDSEDGRGRGPEASIIRTEVAEALRRQAGEVRDLIDQRGSPRAA